MPDASGHGACVPNRDRPETALVAQVNIPGRGCGQAMAAIDGSGGSTNRGTTYGR
jgi:hypothetical protein